MGIQLPNIMIKTCGFGGFGAVWVQLLKWVVILGQNHGTFFVLRPDLTLYVCDHDHENGFATDSMSVELLGVLHEIR